MKYLLEPMNEGQGMNARTIFIGNRQAAMKRASVIASTIQKLLPNCRIACQVQTTSQGLQGVAGIIAHCDGTFVDGQNGDFTEP